MLNPSDIGHPGSIGQSQGMLHASLAQFSSAMAPPLQPHQWQPGDPPPRMPPCGAAPPLLLLINSRLSLPPTKKLLDHLSKEEYQRHQAYRHPADRLRFLVGRASLRVLLGHWLRQSPGSIQLQARSQGKPHCPEGPAFNVSHSGDLILLGFHATSAVGVDVEVDRPGLDWTPIARRVLPAREVEALCALPPAEQASVFLQVWCRLEARLKADGSGLWGLERMGNEDSAVWDVAVPTGYAAAAALMRAHRTPLGRWPRAHPAASAGADHPSLPG